MSRFMNELSRPKQTKSPTNAQLWYQFAHVDHLSHFPNPDSTLSFITRHSLRIHRWFSGRGHLWNAFRFYESPLLWHKGAILWYESRTTSLLRDVLSLRHSLCLRHRLGLRVFVVRLALDVLRLGGWLLRHWLRSVVLGVRSRLLRRHGSSCGHASFFVLDFCGCGRGSSCAVGLA